MIDPYTTTDPTSLHEVYTNLLRIPEIDAARYKNFEEFIQDEEFHNHDAENVQNDGNNNPGGMRTDKLFEILKYREQIKTEIDKEREKSGLSYPEDDPFDKSGGKSGMDKQEKDDKFDENMLHTAHLNKIEDEIRSRDRHVSYLISLYYEILDIETEVKRLEGKVVNEEFKSKYDMLLYHYQFGLANDDLKNFSSINTSMKYMRKLFKRNNNAVVSKELFENLTIDQKQDLKSFHKLKFKTLCDNGTIKKYHMKQLDIIKNYLKIVFFEDKYYNVQVQVIYKDKKSKAALCGRSIMKTKTSIILKFTITQEKVLLLMKKDPNSTERFGEVLDFNVGGLNTIINELFKTRAPKEPNT